MSEPSNSFVGLFSQALVSQGHRVFDFDWQRTPETRPDVVIMHWPYEVLGVGGLRGVRGLLWHLRVLARLRRAGTKIIWVAHNLEPHDGGRAAGLLMSRFLRSVDGILHLSSYSRAAFAERYDIPARVAQIVTVHGHYLTAMTSPPSPAEPVRGPVRLAYFGQVRPYKNVDRLARAVVSWGPQELQLSISGMSRDASLASELHALADAYPDVLHLDLRPDPLSDEDIERCVDRANGVVLPYRAVLNSGAALFALCRSRPILVPRLGALPELQESLGPDWVQLYDGDLDEQTVAEFGAWLRARPSASVRPDLSAFEWTAVAADIESLIETVRAPGHSRDKLVGQRPAAEVEPRRARP